MEINRDVHWIRYGNPKQSSSFTGDLIGKYLFFSAEQRLLIDIAEDEINKHDFIVAKVSTTPSGTDYVLCLYWTDDKRKYELKKRYVDRKDIKYRYWKSNEDTRKGTYSKQHILSCQGG